MDIITIKLIEDKINIPLDMIIIINGYCKFEQLSNKNIKSAVNLWFENKSDCLFKFGHISNWNTSQVTYMSWLFCESYDFNEDISKWDVSNVTNMLGMFCDATRFNCDISEWNVSKVKYMNQMFDNSRSFNCNLNKWDISNVENMNWMFNKANSFDKNNIKQWNLEHVTNKYHMFD